MAHNTDNRGTLKQVELFSGISESALVRIVEISAPHHFSEGEMIYQVDDNADNVYVLVSGRVRFNLHFGDQPISSGSIMTSRQMFGWAALIKGMKHRVANAECVESSTVLAINGDRLLEVFDDDPKGGFLVMRRLAAMIARNFMDLPHP